MKKYDKVCCNVYGRKFVVRFPLLKGGGWCFIYSKRERVRDSHIGTLCFCAGQWKFSPIITGNNEFGEKINYPLFSEKNTNIIVVLESPHKDEYDAKFRPILPAQGTTGKNIQQKLQGKLVKNFGPVLVKHVTYDVFLVNSVQYQTSCHHVSGQCGFQWCRYKKNLIFNSFISCNAIASDLLRRLRLLNPCLVLNCCTLGNRNQNNKNLVKQLIGTVMSIIGQSYKEENHPSSWK